MAVLIAEILAAILHLDLAFLIGLAMNNLFFVFGFAAVGFIHGNCRKLFRNFVVFTTVLLCTMGLTQIAGVGFFPAGNTVFFLCFIVSPVLIFCSGTGLEKHTRKIIVGLILALSFVL